MVSPRVSPEPPSSLPPLPQDNPLSDKIAPPLSGESFGQPKSPFRTFLTLVLGIGVLAALAFAVWKFIPLSLPVPFGGGGVTLTYWGLWEDENLLRSVFDEYEASHRGIKIIYKKENPKEYRERLQAALSQGQGPDIFRFHNTWVPMLKTDLAPVPVSVFSTGDFQKTFYPVATQDLQQGNTIYGIPLEIDGLALLYNTKIFEDARVSPPKNWEEFQQAAQTLTVKDTRGKIQTAGVALGITKNVDYWSDILALLFLQNGVDLRNPQGKLAEDALFFYTSFAQGNSKTWDDTLPPSTLAFTQGKVAMVFIPSWEILNIKAANPQLNFGVLPVPLLPGAKIAWASYWVEGVSFKSPHQAESWEFLKYLSQKETLSKLYTEAARARTFGEPYSRQDLAQSLKDDPYLGSYIQQASYARSFYMASRTYDNGINDKIIKYFEDAVNVVNQGVAPRSALETTANGVKQVLSTYGIAVPPAVTQSPVL